MAVSQIPWWLGAVTAPKEPSVLWQYTLWRQCQSRKSRRGSVLSNGHCGRKEVRLNQPCLLIKTDQIFFLNLTSELRWICSSNNNKHYFIIFREENYKCINDFYSFWLQFEALVEKNTEFFEKDINDELHTIHYSSNCLFTTTVGHDITMIILHPLSLLLRSCTGLFHFRLVWPEIGAYNEWLQESNPINSQVVVGFQGMKSCSPQQKFK